MKIAQILIDQGYSLQGNRKTQEGEDHLDRDAQFRYINRQVKRTLAEGAPVISVDTKKMELVGNYSNGGRQWLPEKNPVKMIFPILTFPELIPMDSTTLSATPRNTGFVNVGEGRGSSFQ
jgi:hypothetical protein